MLIVFDDMTADTGADKKLSPIVTDFIMKITNKRGLQQIVSNHSSGIELKNLMKLYKDNIKEPFPCLVNNTTLPSDNPEEGRTRFRRNLL